MTKFLARCILVLVLYFAVGAGVMFLASVLHDWWPLIPGMGYEHAVGVAVPVWLLAVVLRGYFRVSDGLDEL